MTSAARECREDARRGIALVTVLYFIIVVGFIAAAVFVAARRAAPSADRMMLDAALVAAAETAAYEELEIWRGAERSRQAIGSLVSRAATAPPPLRGVVVHVMRLTSRMYALVAVASAVGGATRRVNLLVRVPTPRLAVASALVSAGNVAFGATVRVVADTIGSCADEGGAAVVVAPGASVEYGSAPVGGAAHVITDSLAGDTITYSRVADVTWSDLAARADIRLAAGAQLTPEPLVDDDRCIERPSNWGEPRRVARQSPCVDRLPLVYAAGDVTVNAGRGQGVLLVEGRLRIAGPFEFSGQIVARDGIESLSDGIEISGIVMSAARSAAGDAHHGGETAVSFRHDTILRFSRCDAQHGVASWLQPRVVRERGWAELF